MNTEILRKIGLTEGEIRVYEALAYLGQSSTGPIMDKSGISSTKVYLILERLIQRGLVCFIVENNVKKFQIANPQNIIEYLDKKYELKKLEEESQKPGQNGTDTSGQGQIGGETKTKTSLTIPMLIGAALADAVNPCEFAVLIILLSSILANGSKK